jgi:tetratricopeptide (TPR) repeat protein
MAMAKKSLAILLFIWFVWPGLANPGTADDLATAEALSRKSMELSAAGRLQEALAPAQESLKILERVLGPKDPNMGAALNNLAIRYKDLGDYQKALPLARQALKIAESSFGPRDEVVAVCLNNLASLYQASGAFDEALPLYQRALKIKLDIFGPDHVGITKVLNNLAGLYEDRGDFDQAMTLLRKVLEIDVRFYGKEHPEVATDLNNLGHLYREMGIYDQSLAMHQKALEIRERKLNSQHPDVAFSLNNLATVYQHMGALDQALPLFKRALEIREAALGPDHPKTITTLSDLAGVYADLGDNDQSLILYEKALEKAQRILGPTHWDTAVILNNLALLHAKRGAMVEAIALQQQTIELHKKIFGPDHPHTTNLFHNLGFQYFRQKNYRQAEDCFRQARSQVGLVDLYLATGRAAAALKMLQDMVPSWRSTPGYQAQYYTQQGLALFGVGRWTEAVVSLAQAVEVIEALRLKAPGERATFFQSGLVGGFIQAYRGLVAALAEGYLKGEALPRPLHKYGPDSGAAAFYFAESTKARALLEAMATGARRYQSMQVPEDSAKREQELLDRLGALEAQWDKHYTRGEDAVKHFQKQREELQGELDQLVAELRKSYPRYAALKYPQPLKPQEIPLKKGEILLEYALGDKESYLFRVEPGGATRVFRLALGQEELEKRLAPLLAHFRQDDLQRRDLQDFCPKELARLYQDILAPALKGVEPGTQLILVPDGVLGAFPLEALVVQAGQDWGDSVLVADTWPVTYAQSAAVLALNRLLGPSRAGQPLFALGDCLYDQESSRYLAFKAGKGQAGALAPAGPEKPLTMAATRVEWGQLTFRPLPQTRQTVTQLAALFDTGPRPPLVLLDVLATETRVRQAPLNQCRYLFFGTHGFLADKMAGQTQPVLVLTQVENQSPDDGFLTFSEVLELKLDADLVTLAACMTGVGQVMQGEGVLNFARAFQQAGARSVMVALWNIPVQESLQFYQTFYQALQAGKTKLAALQEARQAVRAKEPHPYFWAGLSLHGEG